MDFPYKYKKLSNEESEQIRKDFTGYTDDFIQVGPKKYVLSETYCKKAAILYEFQVRRDDIWVSTFPRSGTTLMQELVWLIANNLDFETASKSSLLRRFPFIDLTFMLPDELTESLTQTAEDPSADMQTVDAAVTFTNCMANKVAEAKSPRFIKTHLPFSLLPPNLLSTAKCVYVARNPKDVAVSFYYHNRLFNGIGFVADFPTYWNYLERDLLSPGPYWENIREAWNLRDNPNLLFLFYEDIVTDWKACIQKVASFLGKKLSEEQTDKLANHMHIDNFRRNRAVNFEMDDIPGLLFKEGEQSFIRKGQVHGSKAEFSPELNTRADKWIAENLAKIPGFSFPNKCML